MHKTTIAAPGLLSLCAALCLTACASNGAKPDPVVASQSVLVEAPIRQLVPIDPALTEPVSVTAGLGIKAYTNADLLAERDELWTALHLANGQLLAIRAASYEAVAGQ